ncbi:serine/threonine-protein kinase [Planctellipticum variicoloris]|uniref:serine/threonine-protein kinase n=1 Tax=Planctellipticum variicoloris TaxID=3064265 RepID=UPI0030137213|nr:protein kinase [Planctomycetaceae bacterium SH412]
MASSLSQRPGENGGNPPLSGVVLPWRGPISAGSETVINVPRRDVVDDSTSLTPVNNDLLVRLFPLSAEVARQGEDSENIAGVKIGHFTLERRIGFGGMGSVFLAWDDRLHRRVAVKVLSPSQAGEATAVQRFQNEARAAAQLDHENIARVFYYGEEQGLHYIAYEFVTGQNLRDIIHARGRLEPADAVNLTIQLAGALNHTSTVGVVHRDIKPSNIILTPNGRAKLVDLGLARQESLPASQELTVAGTTLGTFDYISPEQARDPRNVDVRSDIYSLGCTLYHSLTGEPPYPEGTVLQKLLEHQANDPPDPARKNRRVPPALSAVVRKMMASDPRRRYSTPDELIRDLLVVARQLGLRATSREGVVYRAEPRTDEFWRQNAGWVATALALMLLVLAVQYFPGLTQPLAQSPTSIAPVSVPQNGQPPAAIASTDQKPLVGAGVENLIPTAGVPADSSTGVIPNPGGEPGREMTPANELAIVEGAKSPGPSNPPFPPRPESVDPQTVAPFGDPAIKILKGAATGGVVDLPAARSGIAETATSSAGSVAFPDRLAPGNSPGPLLQGGVAPAVTPTPLSPALTAEDIRPSIVVLDSAGGKTAARSYPSLEAACTDAKDGAIVELRYNGRWGAVERPIRLTNKRLTIRAGSVRNGNGFRPIVEFAPQTLPSDPADSRMITITGGALEVHNVAFHLNLAEYLPADRWAVYSLQRAEKLDLRGVHLTVSNPHRQTAAVVESTTPPGQALTAMSMMKTGIAAAGADLSIGRSLIRGGAELLHVSDAAPLRVNVVDSAFALEEVLLHVVGPMDSPPDNVSVRLDLSHATCLLGNGLALLESADEFGSRLLPVQISARNNLIALRGDHALLEIRSAADTVDDVRQQFTFGGERNFYDQLGDFWRITPGPGDRSAADTMKFEEWQRFWGSGELNSSQNLPLDWGGRNFARSLSEIVIDDLRLDERTANPLVGGATDGLDIGAPLEDLPSTASPAAP